MVIVHVEVVIDTVTIHGAAGAVSGAIKAKSEKSHVFCDIIIYPSRR